METSIVVPDFVDARIGPRGSLENLSQAEIEKLLDSRAGGLYPLFRKCALAVLNTGNESDDAAAITGVALPVDCGLTAGNIVMSRELTLEDF